MPFEPAEREKRPVWCPYCEKTTDHRVLARRAPGEPPLEPAEPPVGLKWAVTCLSCGLMHSWWARRPPG